jgi:hypothetical protein
LLRGEAAGGVAVFSAGLSGAGVTGSAMSATGGAVVGDTGVAVLSLVTAAWAVGDAVSGSVLVPEFAELPWELPCELPPGVPAGLPGLAGLLLWEFPGELACPPPEELPWELPGLLPCELPPAFPDAAGDGFPPPLLPEESGPAAAVALPASKSPTTAEAAIATRAYGLFIPRSQVFTANPCEHTRRVSKQSLMWDETPAQATMGRGLHCG